MGATGIEAGTEARPDWLENSVDPASVTTGEATGKLPVAHPIGSLPTTGRTEPEAELDAMAILQMARGDDDEVTSNVVDARVRFAGGRPKR